MSKPKPHLHCPVWRDSVCRCLHVRVSLTLWMWLWAEHQHTASAIVVKREQEKEKPSWFYHPPVGFFIIIICRSTVCVWVTVGGQFVQNLLDYLHISDAPTSSSCALVSCTSGRGGFKFGLGSASPPALVYCQWDFSHNALFRIFLQKWVFFCNGICWSKRSYGTRYKWFQHFTSDRMI